MNHATAAALTTLAILPQGGPRSCHHAAAQHGRQGAQFVTSSAPSCAASSHLCSIMQVLALVKVSPTVLQTAAAVLCSTSAPETVQVLDIRELPLPGFLETSLLADVLLSNGTRTPLNLVVRKLFSFAQAHQILHPSLHALIVLPAQDSLAWSK